MSLESLFKPKTIALIGASHSEEKLGGIILKNLLKSKARLYPINPKYETLMGLKSYPSIDEIPEPVDLSIIIRPAEDVPELLIGHKGRARCVVIMSAGYAEVGRTLLQEELKRLKDEGGFRVLGPNCMGIYDPYERLDMIFLPSERVRRPKKGNLAVVSQSGAIIHCLFALMRQEGIGISKAITYGNALDINESDIYEYLLNDPRTEVVASYIESVGDGRRFLESATSLAQRKPLIVLRAGKDSFGKRAAFSHTGRLAGRYDVFRSIINRTQLIEAIDFDEFSDYIKAISYQRPKEGKNILIVTNGGGSGVLASDECIRKGLTLNPISEQSAQRLKEIFPPFYVIGNPTDLTAQVRDEDYQIVLNELKDQYDGFLVIALSGVLGITPRLGKILSEFKASSKKPLVVHSTCGTEGGLIRDLRKSNIPVYPSSERAIRALRALLR